MKRSQKINSIMIMALVACFSVLFGLVLLMNPSSSKASATPATITMLDADIRLESDDDRVDGDVGLRVGFKIKEEVYNALVASSTAEVGVLVCPTDLLDGEALTLEKVSATLAMKALSPIGVGEWKQVGDDYVSYVYLKKIPAASYNRPISAIAYIDWNDGESPVDYATSTVTVCIADLALKARAEITNTDPDYAELDSYILDYAITIEGNDPVNYEYGSVVNAAKPGYTLDSLQLKTGESTYKDPVASVTVKYAATYKANYSAEQATHNKPGLGAWQFGGISDSNGVSDGNLKLKGAQLLKNAVIAEGSDYVLEATFTRSEATELGFVITTDNNWNGSVKHFMFVYRDGSRNDMYFWGKDIWHSLGKVTAPAVGEEMKLQVVYKDAKYYVLINEEIACNVSETATQDGGASPKAALGSGDIYVGLVSMNKLTTFTDWSYSTDPAVINAISLTKKTFAKPTEGAWLYGGGAKYNDSGDFRGAYTFNAPAVASDADYLLYATFTRSNASELGFVITSDNNWSGSVKNFMFIYRRDAGDMYFWGSNIWHSLGAVTAPAVGETMKLEVVHKNAKFYVFINGVKAVEVAETATQDGGKSPKAALGSGDVYLGVVSLNASTTFTDWGYTIDSAKINVLVPDAE